jgi:hypothetical protein
MERRSLFFRGGEPITHSADDFLISAKDEKGHRARMQFHMQPALLDQISEIVGSKRFPFRYQGDFCRWAAHEGVRYVLELEPDIPSQLAVLEAANDFLRTREKQTEIQAHLQRVRDLIRDMWSRRAYAEVVLIYTRERARAEAHFKLEPFWAAEWLRGLQDAEITNIAAAAEAQLESISLLPNSKNGEGR